jgi:hypothetical protein
VKTRTLVIGVLTAVAAALVLLFWPQGQTPEDEVREVLTEMAAGAEEGDIQAVLSPIAEDWREASGMSRTNLQAVLMREFLRGRRLHVILGPILVEVDEPRASATFEMWLAEGASDFPLWPARNEVLRAEVELERRDGDWLLVETRVRELDGDVVAPR